MDEKPVPSTEPAAAGDRLAEAIAAIDAANADDPNRIVVDGIDRPKEQAHAELMTSWVQRLDPGADAAQLIAARAHHLRRWEVPRSSYPDGRSGYLRWRTLLRRRHAEAVAAILTTVGYDETFVARVSGIVRKVGLGDDPAVQTHEDALCLVFLQTQLDDLIESLGEDQTVEVVRKSLAKMSDQGITRASEIGLSTRGGVIVERASASDV